MDGALHIHEGVLYVGRFAKTAHVRSFDLDGHALETHFEFRDEAAGRSSVGGLAVDADHRIWIADGAAAKLRTFTLVGRQIAVVDGEPDEDRAMGAPSSVCVAGEDDDLVVTVGSAGRRRHAVHELHPASGAMRSLRPLGRLEKQFEEVSSLERDGEDLFVCERRARRVQVFRGGAFHYAIELESLAPFSEPRAAVPVGGGRLVVALASLEEGEPSGLVLVDASGRLQRVLAESGLADREVDDPCALAVERGRDDHDTRLAVLDRAGGRLQVFTLDGRCYGAFVEPERRSSRS